MGFLLPLLLMQSRITLISEIKHLQILFELELYDLPYYRSYREMDNKSCFEMVKLCVFFSCLLISPIIASTNDLWIFNIVDDCIRMQ